jgi:hypothetical protein
MYNTKYLCTYNSNDVFLENDNVNGEEVDFIRHILYKQDILNIFDVEEYDDKEFNKEIHVIYEKIKHCEKLKNCITKLANDLFSEDLEIGLIILFSYDYLYLSHLCISEYLETGDLLTGNINKLESIILDS